MQGVVDDLTEQLKNMEEERDYARKERDVLLAKEEEKRDSPDQP